MIGDIEDIISRMKKQADVLESYAESHGFSGKAPASAFHWQATHFRDLADELLKAYTAHTTQEGTSFAVVKSSGDELTDRLRTALFHCDGEVTTEQSCRIASGLADLIRDDEGEEDWGLSLRLAESSPNVGEVDKLAIVAAELSEQFPRAKPSECMIAAQVVLAALARPVEVGAGKADDPDHQYAVVSSDYRRPFLVGAYPTLAAALLAQDGKPDRWHIYRRLPAAALARPVEAGAGKLAEVGRVLIDTALDDLKWLLAQVERDHPGSYRATGTIRDLERALTTPADVIAQGDHAAS